MHVHFMPDRVMRKVWDYFDSAGPLTGRHWPIRYRWSDDDRLEHLRAMGVRAFPALIYPHKPGMAEWLNDWARPFAREHADVIPTATFFPEPGVEAYVDHALAEGAKMFKVHLQVGAFDPRDPVLDPVWGRLAEAGVPVVVHAGSGPTPGAFTGPGPFGEVLARHPTLAAVIAHMGMPEYDAFLRFAETYPHVRVDTTMCFVDFFDPEHAALLRAELAPRLADLRDRVLFGADFPNIPYDYAHQIDVLTRLDLGDDWMRAVLWHNASRLLGFSSG
jgi:predicted TIM-barrel fold metal-dependent hydrolase